MEESKDRQIGGKPRDEKLADVAGGVSPDARPSYHYRCIRCNKMIHSSYAKEICMCCNGPLKLEQYFP